MQVVRADHTFAVLKASPQALATATLSAQVVYLTYEAGPFATYEVWPAWDSVADARLGGALISGTGPDRQRHRR